MIANGYEDKRTLARRGTTMEQWLISPELLIADGDAE